MSRAVAKPSPSEKINLPTIEEWEGMTLSNLKKELSKYGLATESLAKTTKAKKVEMIERLKGVVPNEYGGWDYKGSSVNHCINVDYATLSVAELKFAIDVRNDAKAPNAPKITKTGNKAELVKKLEEDEN